MEGLTKKMFISVYLPIAQKRLLKSIKLFFMKTRLCKLYIYTGNKIWIRYSKFHVKHVYILQSIFGQCSNVKNCGLKVSLFLSVL